MAESIADELMYWLMLMIAATMMFLVVMDLNIYPSLYVTTVVARGEINKTTQLVKLQRSGNGGL